MSDFENALLFGLLFVIAFYLFRRFIPANIEGMTDASDASVASSDNGIAGNAAAYGAALKAANIKSLDMLLINKYRKDYETAVLNAEDLIDSLMLQTTLSIDYRNNPMSAVEKLGSLQQAKTALNSVMKFVDSSS